MDDTRNDWLGLAFDSEGRSRFELTPALARFDGKLFGGTGLALSIASFEAVTGRGALWVTVQFVGSADVGDHLDIEVEVLAKGHRTCQTRLTATKGDQVILVALGSTAILNPDGLSVPLMTMPEVSKPEDSPSFELSLPFELPDELEMGPFVTGEYREAKSSAATQRVWARMRDRPQTRASLGYLADFVPAAVMKAAGQVGGGRSLDNSIRFGSEVPEGLAWVLIDNEPYMAENGYVHGAARIWSSDGELLAVASQSAVAVPLN